MQDTPSTGNPSQGGAPPSQSSPPGAAIEPGEARRIPRWVLWLGGVSLARLFLAAVAPVFPEESYHWCYARHPALSYFDHPPMIAWAIALGRLVFGDSPLGVRLVPLLLSTGMAILLCRMARRLYGERAALWTVLLLAVEPIVFAVTGAGFPDSPLLFFWTLALVFIYQALESRRGAWWLAAGAALGAAMLSKYTACFLTLGVLGYLATTRRDRFWLARPWPYLGCALALVVFTPVLAWNWTHDWASFRFQSVSRFDQVQGLNLRTGFTYLLGQWLGILPLTLPIAVIALRRAARSSRWEDRFLFWLFVPMFGFFFALGWARSIHLLWPLPAYLGLTVLMAGTIAQSDGRIPEAYSRHGGWLTATVVVGFILMTLHLWVGLPGVPMARDVHGWDQVARRARQLHADLPEGSFYLGIGRRYICPSQLAFYLDAPSEVHGKNLLGEDCLQFNYWSVPESLRGRDAIVVVPEGDKDASVRKLPERFESVTRLEDIVIPEGRASLPDGRAIRFTLYRAHGYLPPEAPPISTSQ